MHEWKNVYEYVPKLQFVDHAHRPPDEPEDVPRKKEGPVFVLKPEPFTVAEGEWARFVCRVTGYPRPRVMWLINGHTVMNVSGIVAATSPSPEADSNAQQLYIIIIIIIIIIAVRRMFLLLTRTIASYVAGFPIQADL
jgi:hypothetical protein